MGLEDYSARSVLACAARFARRVLPLVEADNRPSAAADLSFAYSVAAGEPMGFMRLPNGPSHLSERRDKVGAPALSAARFAGAAAIELSKVIEATSDFDVMHARELTFKLLNGAFSHAQDAAFNASPVSPGSKDLIGAAFSGDWSVLATIQRISAKTDWLGQPIDPEEDGPFGKLWPAGAPVWYSEMDRGVMEPREPTIVSGENVEHSPELIKRADIICWHFDQKSGFPLEHLTAFIEDQVATSNKHQEVPRIFVVHAPGLADKEAARLVMAGATFLGDEKVGDTAPVTSSDLVEALGAWMRKGYMGWKLEGGQWRYTGRGPLAWAPPYPAAAFETDREQLTSPNREAYLSLIQASKSFEQRLESESGWPVDI